jgi:hypothetical protein
MPIKKNQDVAEKAGKKTETTMDHKKEEKEKESNVGKNQKKQAQKPG